MHVVITSLLNTEAKQNSCSLFEMKRIDNYFHTNKKRKEDGESSETMASGRSSVDFIIEKVLPDCPEKHFILDEEPTAEKRGKYSETIPASIKIGVAHTLIQMGIPLLLNISIRNTRRRNIFPIEKQLKAG